MPRPVPERVSGRRRVLAGIAAAGATALLPPVPPAFARRLPSTPRQSEGPFYPADLPLDRDADLAQLAGRSRRATGTLVDLTGQVLDPEGRPLPGARLELWQANSWGRYAHPRDSSDKPLDPNFQGYGAAITDGDGRYRFRTIRPAGYGNAWFRRPPHLHFRITGPDGRRLTTQMYFAGDPDLARDSILAGAGRHADRLVVPFADTPEGGQTGHFEVVLG